jgi:hypothetical protein
VGATRPQNQGFWDFSLSEKSQKPCSSNSRLKNDFERKTAGFMFKIIPP